MIGAKLLEFGLILNISTMLQAKTRINSTGYHEQSPLLESAVLVLRCFPTCYIVLSKAYVHQVDKA